MGVGKGDLRIWREAVVWGLSILVCWKLTRTWLERGGTWNRQIQEMVSWRKSCGSWEGGSEDLG